MIEIDFIFGCAIFGLVFAVIFFLVLPFGVETSEEAGEELAKGASSSAPHKPYLGRKLLITFFISGLVYAALYYILTR